MGWKNVKEAYQIKHIVQICDGQICIGSAYSHNLLSVSSVGDIKWGALGPSKNDDLARYYADMTADKAKLVELIHSADIFDKSIIVYTYDYDSRNIIQKQCEELGWPNVTYDGMVMYDNTFSADKQKVIKWAIRENELGIEFAKERIEEALVRVETGRKDVAEYTEKLKRLKEIESLEEARRMSSGEIDNCPICDKLLVVTKRWNGSSFEATRKWDCVHMPEEYQAALEKYEERLWDMSLEMAGEDA